MQSLVKFLEGKKTYLSAFAMLVVAILGVFTGTIGAVNASALVAASLGMMGLRAGNARAASVVLAEVQELKRAYQQSSAGGKVDLRQEAQILTEVGIKAATNPEAGQ